MLLFLDADLDVLDVGLVLLLIIDADALLMFSLLDILMSIL